MRLESHHDRELGASLPYVLPMRCHTTRLPHLFTYFIGNSLYVPLTSRCNSATLPYLRGPKFQLHSSIIASLCRVRDAEHNSQVWASWIQYLDQQDVPQSLPDSLQPVDCLSDIGTSIPERPSADELLEEINCIIEESHRRSFPINAIVFAGEGEPTLRMGCLLRLASCLKLSHPATPLRCLTNGLTASLEAGVPQKLMEAGISQVSVMLLTNNAMQYGALMKPLLKVRKGDLCRSAPTTNVGVAHKMVCEFIREAVACGLQVEATAVDARSVDKKAVEELATKLGAHSFRWRSYLA